MVVQADKLALTKGEWKMKSMALAVVFFMITGASFAATGMVIKSSKYPVGVTIDRLEAVAREKGMTLFARIDHAAGAEKVGMKMPPSQVLIFGNPKGGTPLMLASPSAALELPLRVAVWEDAQGKVWLGYNTVEYVSQRHAVNGKDELVKMLDGALDGITSKALD